MRSARKPWAVVASKRVGEWKLLGQYETRAMARRWFGLCHWLNVETGKNYPVRVLPTEEALSLTRGSWMRSARWKVADVLTRWATAAAPEAHIKSDSPTGRTPAKRYASPGIMIGSCYLITTAEPLCVPTGSDMGHGRTSRRLERITQEAAGETSTN